MAGKLRMAAEIFLPPLPVPPGEDESIASFIGRRFGRQAVQRLGEPLLAGIHGGDANRLSMRALFPRFLELEQTDGSVIRGLRRHRTAPRAAPFVSISGGTEMLVRALVASLPHDSLISGIGVSNVEWRGEWRVHLATGRHVDAPALLLATPPRAIADLVHHLDPALTALLRCVHDVPLITVALGYKREDVRHPLAGSGFVVPKSEGASVNAVAWMSSKWIGRAPDDRVLLRASAGGARNPSATSWSDTDLITRVREDLRRYLRLTGAPVFARVFRMPHGGVQMDVGHLRLIEQVQAHLHALPGVFMSAAGIRGVGIADCVDDARKQAAEVAEFVRFGEKPYAGAVSG